MPGPELPEGLRYRAFFSYSSKDGALAERIIRRLESYRTPKTLIGLQGKHGPIPESLGKICQDRQEFPTAAYVDSVIAEKLSQSQMLVVLCTPAAVEKGSWVPLEIGLFRQLRPDAEIHCIIGAGEPPACFPTPLLVQEADGRIRQPLAADMRKQQDGPDKAIVKLLAGLLGVDFDKLWRRDRRRRRAKAAWTATAVAASGVLLGYAAAWVDMQQWRNALAAESLSVWSEGRTLDALPLALASATREGVLVPAVGAQARAALERQPGTALKQELGTIRNPPYFSSDGAVLVADAGDSQFVLNVATGRRSLLDKGDQFQEFSSNSAWLAGRAADGSGFVLNLESWTRVPLNIQPDIMHFTPDSKRLIARVDSVRSKERFGFAFELSSANRTPLGALHDFPEFSVDGKWIAAENVNGNGFVLNLDSGKRIPLRGLTDRPKFRPDARAIAVVENGNGFVLDLESHARRPLGSVHDVLGFSQSGDWLAMNVSGKAGAVFNLAAGTRILLDRILPESRFSHDSTRLILFTPGSNPEGGIARSYRTYGNGYVLDLVSRAKTPLGPLSYSPEFSLDGRRLAGVSDEGHGFVLEFANGVRTELGVLSGLPVFSSDGARIAAVSEDGNGFTLEFTTGKRRPVGNGRLRFRPKFSLDGTWVVTVDVNGVGYITQLATGFQIPLGILQPGTQIYPFEFSPDKTHLAVVAMDSDLGTNVLKRTTQSSGHSPATRTAFLIGLDTTDERTSTTAQLVHALCSVDAGGQIVRSFTPDLRAVAFDNDRLTDEGRRRRALLRPILTGRPWNPCDWRGLGAVLPNPTRGDGWFEGIQQWWRWLMIRWFAATDYRCGEVNAAGETRDYRLQSCRNAGVPEAGIAGRTASAARE